MSVWQRRGWRRVRDRKALLEKIEALLATEGDINMARELVRAAILLGGRQLVTPALATSARLDHRLDGPIAVAVARLGAGEAIPLYFSKLQKLESTPRTNFFRVALWGTPMLVTSTAARILGTGDSIAWNSFLGALDESSMFLDAGVLRIALEHKNPDIRESTIRLAVASLTDRRQTVDPKAKEVLTQRLEVEISEPAHISFDHTAVLLEALVTETGCVREAHLVGQSPIAELNAAALLALLQWEFEPAESNGIAIPVLFELGVHFMFE